VVPTPSPNATTPIYPAPAGEYVIQNATQWAADNYNNPVPSVNFNDQMILEYTQGVVVDCLGSVVLPSITSVCFYSDHIEVNGTKAIVSNPLPVTPSPGTTTVICNSIFAYSVSTLASIPQSNLPVVWNMQ